MKAVINFFRGEWGLRPPYPHGWGSASDHVLLSSFSVIIRHLRIMKKKKLKPRFQLKVSITTNANFLKSKIGLKIEKKIEYGIKYLIPE